MNAWAGLLACLLVGCSGPVASSDPPTGTPKTMAVPKPFREIVYASPGGQPLKLDFYPIQVKNAPLAVLIHGGGWSSGSRSDLGQLARAFMDADFAVASIDYRLSGVAKWPAQAEDVESAVLYLRSHAKELGIDPGRIVASGESAGGHLSLWLGSVSAKGARVQAVGSISGIHDLSEPMTPEGSAYRIVERLLPDMTSATVRGASPGLRAGKDGAPTYFLTGADDPWVPPSHSQKTAARLKALGVPVAVSVLAGMRHGLNLGRTTEKVAFRRMAEWLTEHL